MTDPEVDLEVSGAAKLPVADLEGDGHAVIALEGLVEALATVGGEVDVVGEGRVEEASCQEQLGGRCEEHVWVVRSRGWVGEEVQGSCLWAGAWDSQVNWRQAFVLEEGVCRRETRMFERIRQIASLSRHRSFGISERLR